MARAGNFAYLAILGLALGAAGAVLGQDRAVPPADDLVPLAEYGRLLDPVMSAAERSAWSGLRNDAARRDFLTAFWQRRDPTPGTPVNEVRDIFLVRARRALERFDDASTPGYATDRGRVLLVYGLPDEQELRAVPLEAPPTLTWKYSRHTPSLTVRFARPEAGGDFVLTEPLELSDAAFARSLREDLGLRLATAVGDRHGALTPAETLAREEDPAETDSEPELAPPAVAPEVQVWLEAVYAGRTRSDLDLRRRLFHFPATEGTYTVLSFEVGTEALEFVDPMALELPETEEESQADGSADTDGDGEADAASERVLELEQERPETAAEIAARLGLAQDEAEEDEVTPVADLRVFGAFLQGEPGSEDTMHSFVIPYRLAQDDTDALFSRSLSLGVTLYPGEYRLVWGVMDAGTQWAVTADEVVQVPDYTVTELTLTRPLLAGAELRDDPRPMSTTMVYEGVRLGNVLASNDVDDLYARDATVQVVVVATGWGSDPAAPGKPRLEVEYRVLEGLEGEESIARLPSQVLDFHVLGQEIPLGQINRLRPGRSYRIEIRVKDLVSGAEAVQRAPIHLRPEISPNEAQQR